MRDDDDDSKKGILCNGNTIRGRRMSTYLVQIAKWNRYFSSSKPGDNCLYISRPEIVGPAPNLG